MYITFRRLFLLIAIIAIPLFCTTVYANTMYSTDFETVQSYSWSSLVNKDENGEVTGDWAKVVEKAYGRNNENKALQLKNGENYIKEKGSFDTLSYGPVTDNPVMGTSVFSFDFMIDRESIKGLEDWTEIKLGRMDVKDNANAYLQIPMLSILKMSNNRGLEVRFDDGASTQIGVVQPDRWHRLTVLYLPQTGKATISFVADVDGVSEATTIADYQLTAANIYDRACRIVLGTNRDNVIAYIDNVSLYECESFEITAVSPVDGTQEVGTDTEIMLVFSGKVSSQSVTLNGRSVTFDIDESRTVLKYSSSLIGNRVYNLKGMVTDENGQVCEINLSFKTVPTLKMLSATVQNGDNGIKPTDTILFEFNHRIDPCDNSFSITGGPDIEVCNIKAKTVEIKLSEALEYDKYYTLKLDGLGDLYGEQYSEQQITFKTMGLDVNYARFADSTGEQISVIDPANTRYIAEFINNTSEPKNIIFVMTLTDDDRMKEIIYTPYTVEPGEKLNIDEGFTGLDTQTGNYFIKVFYLDSLKTLSPYDIQLLPIKTIGQQSDM